MSLARKYLYFAYLDEIEKEYADQISLAQSLLGDLYPSLDLF